MTRAAWIKDLEIVEVQYRPSEIAYPDLLQHAIAHSCDQMVFTSSDAQAKAALAALGRDKVRPFEGRVRVGQDSDQLYYLGQSPYRWLPLTPLQARRVNSALHAQRDPSPWLSPHQVQMFQNIQKGLKHAPSAARLKKLKRPARIEELAAYQAQLEQALAPTAPK